ncbi:unnamed protein product [Bemisia tabaci]|uniref:Uncharacterized protein n=1 Tax=Bemisia tabaci TaxID=7038 RepID=A0A9P0F7P9_BEMTA|nr:unnamed protein product [Bemisia tabaci]
MSPSEGGSSTAAEKTPCHKRPLPRRQLSPELKLSVSISSGVLAAVLTWSSGSQSDTDRPAPSPTAKKLGIMCSTQLSAAATEAAVSNLMSHLWYLIPEAAAFSFFDRDISVECKRKIVTALSEENPLEDGEKKIKLQSAEDISGKDVSNFISCSSYKFFERFHLSSNFLKEDLSTWLENPQYLKNREIVKKIKVVNDTAERGVK